MGLSVRWSGMSPFSVYLSLALFVCITVSMMPKVYEVSINRVEVASIADQHLAPTRHTTRRCIRGHAGANFVPGRCEWQAWFLSDCEACAKL